MRRAALGWHSESTKFEISRLGMLNLLFNCHYHYKPKGKDHTFNIWQAHPKRYLVSCAHLGQRQGQSDVAFQVKSVEPCCKPTGRALR
jgi:hypothetical protein